MMIIMIIMIRKEEEDDRSYFLVEGVSINYTAAAASIGKARVMREGGEREATRFGG